MENTHTRAGTRWTGKEGRKNKQQYVRLLALSLPLCFSIGSYIFLDHSPNNIARTFWFDCFVFNYRNYRHRSIYEFILLHRLLVTISTCNTISSRVVADML